ncbi:MAG TPA: VWA domain-containing protein [Bacteroidia bacterium]|jgi:Ca-activated chloride channel family protein
MQFENIYFVYAFAVIPVILLIRWFTARWKKKALKNYGELTVIKQLFPDLSKTKQAWKFIFLNIAFVLLVIGMINPQIGTHLEEVKRKGADIMICLDVSNSMRAEDLLPNRLDRSKLAIAKLVDKLEGDRIGIIVFGGEAYVQLPITTDYAAAKLFLHSISTDMIPTQGTDIEKAINLAVESFGKDEGKNKAVVIITDGENHDQDALDAAEAAAAKGISIHTIGMGSENGAPIPVYKGNVQDGFRKDKEGNTIITKLNEQVLKEIAASGNGVYVRATNSDAGLNSVLSEIDKLEKKQFDSKMYSDYEDRFQWFIAGALLFLLAEILLSERKSRIYKRLDLFGEKKK